MKNLILVFVSIFSLNLLAQDFKINQAIVQYKVKHPFKTIVGVNEQIKGKAICEKSSCQILAALKVKEFTSGNSNRDVHMWQVMKAEKYQNIVVSINQDIEKEKVLINIEMAGIKNTIEAKKKFIQFSKDEMKLDLDFEVNLNDFNIEKPSLLTVAISEIVEIHVESLWKNTNLKN